MIQGNYTVKALECLGSLRQNAVRRGWPQTLRDLQVLEDSLRLAQPFLLPPGGLLFEVEDDVWKWIPATRRLPYPVCALEWTDQGIPFTAVFHEEPTHVAASQSHQPALGVCVFRKVFSTDNGIYPFACATATFTESERLVEMRECVPEFASALGGRNRLELAEEQNDSVSLAICILEQMQCALECRNVRMEDLRPAPALQRKRVKTGKLPLLTYKVLTLDLSRAVTSADWNAVGVERASPRSHWRRGHLRRLATGSIFVRPALIRGAGEGLVVKDYAVTNTDRKNHQ